MNIPWWKGEKTFVAIIPDLAYFPDSYPRI